MSKKNILILLLVILGSILIGGFAYWVWDQSRGVSLEACGEMDYEAADKCIAEVIKKIFKQDGYRAAYAKFGEAIDDYPVLSSACSKTAGFLGVKAYEWYTATGEKFLFPEDIPVEPSECLYGFYAGLLAAWQNDGQDKEVINRICAYINSELPPRGVNQCFFHLGGAAVFLDVPSDSSLNKEGLEKLLGRAISFCKTNATGVEVEPSCISGVFNAVNLAYIEGNYGLLMDNERPLLICEEQDEEYQLRCYRSLASGLYYFSGKNIPLAVDYLKQSIPSYGDEYETLITLFNSLVSEPITMDEIIRICLSFDGPTRNACIQGYATGLIETGETGEEHWQALIFCSNDLFSLKEKALCTHRAFYDLNSVYPGRAGDICRMTVEAELNQYCPL